MPLWLENLNATQLDALSRERTVFFFPVGPLEDHGPHLPLGLDVFEAERLTIIAAERMEKDLAGWTGVIMPRAPLGVDSNTLALAITVRGHVLRDWLVDACHSLTRAGFRKFVAFSGHAGPKQLTAIEEAGKYLRWRAGGMWPLRLFKGWKDLPVLVSASSALVSPKMVSASPLWPDPVEHGGARDTSVALAVAREKVDAMGTSLPPREREPSRNARRIQRWNRTVKGYWGDPSKAAASTGEAELQSQVDDVYPKLRAVWDGANPEMLFRSYYSILPPNRSFYRAWLMATALFVLFMVWIWFSMQQMLQ